MVGQLVPLVIQVGKISFVYMRIYANAQLFQDTIALGGVTHLTNSLVEQVLSVSLSLCDDSSCRMSFF